MTQLTVAELIAKARENPKRSRAKFAEEVGLTSTAIANLEKGRALKDGEWEKLYPHLAPYMDDDGAVQPQASPVSEKVEITEEQQQSLDEMPNAEQRYFSNSELSTFRRCPRKWYFAFYRKLQPREPLVTGARSIGTRVHNALAVYYQPPEQRQDPFAVLEASIAKDLQAFPDQAHEINQEADLCRAMLEGYFEWLQETGSDQGLVITGSEQVLTLPIDVSGQSVYLRGRLDVRAVRESDNVTLFMDHKTVGNFTEAMRTLHMDTQMLMYLLLEYLNIKAQGLEDQTRTDGGLYNMLRKVKRTATAKPPFFERAEVRHNVEELRSFYLRVHGEITRILATEAQLNTGTDHRWVCPPTPLNRCTWDCDFFPVCPMMDDGSNAEGLLEQLYQVGDPNARYGNDLKGVADG